MYARRCESNGVGGTCPDLSQQSNEIWVSCGMEGGFRSITHLDSEGGNTPKQATRRTRGPLSMPAVMGSGAERPFGRPADLGPVDADCVERFSRRAGPA